MRDQDVEEFTRAYRAATGITSPELMRLRVHRGWTADSVHLLRRLATQAQAQHTAIVDLVHARHPQHPDPADREPMVNAVTSWLAIFASRVTDDHRLSVDRITAPHGPHTLALDWAAHLALLTDTAAVDRMISDPFLVHTPEKIPSPITHQQVEQFTTVYRATTGWERVGPMRLRMERGWTLDSLCTLWGLAEHAHTHNTALRQVARRYAVGDNPTPAPTHAPNAAPTHTSDLAPTIRMLANFVSRVTDSLAAEAKGGMNVPPHTVALQWATLLASLTDVRATERLVREPALVSTYVLAAGRYGLLHYAAGLNVDTTRDSTPSLTAPRPAPTKSELINLIKPVPAFTVPVPQWPIRPAMPPVARVQRGAASMTSTSIATAPEAPAAHSNPVALALAAALNGVIWAADSYLAPPVPVPTVVASFFRDTYREIIGDNLTALAAARWVLEGYRAHHVQAIKALLPRMLTPGARLFLPVPTPRQATSVKVAEQFADAVRRGWPLLALTTMRSWTSDDRGITPDMAVAWTRAMLTIAPGTYPTGARIPLAESDLFAWHAALGRRAPMAYAAGMSLDEAIKHDQAGTLLTNPGERMLVATRMHPRGPIIDLRTATPVGTGTRGTQHGQNHAASHDIAAPRSGATSAEPTGAKG